MTGPLQATGTSEYATRLRDAFRTGRNSDVTFVCKGRHFNVHRFQISMHSDVLDTMVNGRFKEKDSREIPLPDDDPIAMEEVFRYMYTMVYSPRVTINSNKCPLTSRKREDVVTSVVCDHSFERAAIYSLLDTSPAVPCPTGGCKAMVTKGDLRDDPAFYDRLNSTDGNLLFLHLHVATAADKYNIRDLHKTALDEFRKHALLESYQDSLARVIHAAYESEELEPYRGMVVGLVASKISTYQAYPEKYEDFWAAVRAVPAFAGDVLCEGTQNVVEKKPAASEDVVSAVVLAAKGQMDAQALASASGH